MARILGKAGRYARETLSKKFSASLIIAFIITLILAVFIGYMFASLKWQIVAPTIAVEIVAILFLWAYLKKAEKEIASWRRGLEGEMLVGRELHFLSDDYHLIHDLQTTHGNIDHIVIGPTGVFIIETKNWRGWVTADGNGELLVNGKPTDKPYVKNLTRKIMQLRERLELSANTPFFQGVIIFPSAYEDAKWGTTGNVHCISLRSMDNYFSEPRTCGKTRLTKKEINDIVTAFKPLIADPSAAAFAPSQSA